MGGVSEYSVILSLRLRTASGFYHKVVYSNRNTIDFSVGHKLFDEDRSVDVVRLRCTCCLKHDQTRAHHLSVSSILKRVVSLLILGVF